jgi:hypothetical protein
MQSRASPGVVAAFWPHAVDDEIVRIDGHLWQDTIDFLQAREGDKKKKGVFFM